MRLGVGQPDLEQPVEDPDILFAQELRASAHVVEPAAARAAFGLRQALEKNPKSSPHRQIVLARKLGEFKGVLGGTWEVAAHQREHGRVSLPKCACTDVSEARYPRFSVADEGGCAPHLAQRPQHKREAKHCRDTRVLPETEGQIVVTAGLKHGKRMFKMFPRLEVLSGEPMRDSNRAVRNSGLGRIRSRLDVA